MENKNTRSLSRLAFSPTYRKFTLFILGAEFISALTGAFSPLIQKHLVDAANNGSKTMIWYALSLIAVLAGGGFACRMAARRCRGLLGIEAKRDLQGKIFKHLLRLPEEFLRSRGAGYFFNRTQTDINETVTFLAGGGMQAFAEIFKFIFAFAAMAVIRWQYALMTLPFIAMQAILCLKFRKRQFHLAKRVSEYTANEQHLMQEFISCHTLVKTNNAADDAQNRIENGWKNWSALMLKKLNNEHFLLALMQIPVWLCAAAVLLCGLLQVANRTATLGDIWALLALLYLLFAPARMLGGVFVQAQSAAAAWERIYELCKKSDAEKNSAALSAVRLTGDIDFDQVTFSYSAEKPLLTSLDLHIPSGSGIFITGKNGSGKSTLLALLLRLFKVDSGEIRIGGTPISKFELSSFRSRIGYIGQRPEFFKGSLRSNLLAGNKNVSDEKIIEHFKALNCTALVESRPGGLDQQVAENGENYSGGELLRLALVRELLRDTDILLFDEPAANLDIESRQQFYNLLEKLPGQKSVLAIVHDLPSKHNWQVFDLSDHQKR